ncbi:MAG TPA: hypothetical protein VHV76_12225 [Mycobacteriales bacterium]|nr:hypothetical protein [Mycobacteriales bacterium]
MSPDRLTVTMQRGVIVALGAAIVAVACAGTADAYWSSTGHGSATAATGTTTLTASITPVSGLYPGAVVPVSVALKNTSSAAGLTVTSLTQSGSTTIQTAGKGSCSPTVVSFVAGMLPSGTISANQTVTASGSVTMTTAAADGCQGATFAIPLIANGHTP